VLALRGSGEAKLPQVDYDLYPSDGPGGLLAVLDDIFAGRRASTRAD
jgi:hypothetical protein